MECTDNPNCIVSIALFNSSSFFLPLVNLIYPLVAANLRHIVLDDPLLLSPHHHHHIFHQVAGLASVEQNSSGDQKHLMIVVCSQSNEKKNIKRY